MFSRSRQVAVVLFVGSVILLPFQNCGQFKSGSGNLGAFQGTSTGQSSVPNGPVVTLSSNPAIVSPTYDTGASFTFTIAAGTTAIASTQCALDSAVPADCVSPMSLTGLAAGIHTFKVIAKDSANLEGSAQITWTVNPPLWPHTVQNGSTGSSLGKSIALDSAGNIFIAGTTTAALDNQLQKGTIDFFISRYTSNGTRLWTIQNGAVGASINIGGIAVDPQGNVVLSGTTNVAIDGQSKIGATDYFITKYSTAGARLWTVENGALNGALGLSYSNQNRVNPPGIDATGNIYFAGSAGVVTALDQFNGVYVSGSTTVILDGQQLPNPTGFGNLFITKYNSAGQRQWTVVNGPYARDITAEAFAVDSTGNTYISGRANVTWASPYVNAVAQPFDGMAGQFNYITKYSTSGVRQFTVQTEIPAANCAVDSAGNIFLSSFYEFRIGKYSPTGARLWVVNPMGGYALPHGLAVDSTGNVYASGGTQFGLHGQTQIGSFDLFVTKYDGNGARLWTTQNGVAGASTRAPSVAIDAGGNAFITGSTSGALDGQTKKGTVDHFISKFSPAGLKY